MTHPVTLVLFFFLSNLFTIICWCTAEALTGYKILEFTCPRLETDEDMQKLIGKQILHAWADKDRQG
jgi:hypothetical protein